MFDKIYIKLINLYANKPKFIKFGIFTIIFVFCCFLLFHSSHNKNNSKEGKNQTPIVHVEAAIKKDMVVYLSALGTVTPTTSITLRTQINGQLLRVLFNEGQNVKKGDILFEIDSRIYDAQLLQYEGQITKDKALLENAQIDLERYKNLIKKQAVSKQILDTQLSLVHQYEGTVKSDQGLIDTAKLNQTYCKIVAPISGRVGLRLVDPGNYVQTTDTKGLVVLNELNPISVLFSLPEDNIQQILKHTDNSKKLKVEIFDREQKNLLATGTLESIDNQVDTTTGTIKFRAFFDNQNNQFFPNQFVNVRLYIETLKDEIVIPTSSIQHTPNGTSVYKLNKDHTVSMIPIISKITDGNDTAITGNIASGDFIVVDGTDKLRDGSSVMLPESKNNSTNQTQSVHMPENEHKHDKLL